MVLDEVMKKLMESAFATHARNLEQSELNSAEFRAGYYWIHQDQDDIMSYEKVCNVLGIDPRILRDKYPYPFAIEEGEILH